MEPYMQSRPTTYIPTPSSDSVEVTFVNHFASSHPTLDPTIMFDSNIFSEIGCFTGNPNLSGKDQLNELLELLDNKETLTKKQADKIEAQRLELEEGLSQLHSSHGPIQKLSQTNVWKHKLKENLSRTLQIKSV